MKSLPKISHKVTVHVGIVLATLLVVAFAFYIVQELEHLEVTAHDKTVNILSALEATHTQSMLNRGHNADGNPVIKVLDGALRQLSNASDNMNIWLVMGPKVLAYQIEHGNELEPPLDAVDREALDTGRAIARFSGNSIYRYSTPIILAGVRRTTRNAFPATKKKWVSVQAK